MSLRSQLPRIIARDPRFPIEAYAFVLEALDHARTTKLSAIARDSTPAGRAGSAGPGRTRARGRRSLRGGHVTGAQLCEAVRQLSLSQYGLLASTVLGHWGIHSTSDIGDIVYNMIDLGALEKTPSDSRSDFDNVFDFATALRPRLALVLDEPA